MQARASTRAPGPAPSVSCTGRLSRHGHRRPVTRWSGGPAVSSSTVTAENGPELDTNSAVLRGPLRSPCVSPAPRTEHHPPDSEGSLSGTEIPPPPRRAVSIVGPRPRGSARGVPRTRTPGGRSQAQRPSAGDSRLSAHPTPGQGGSRVPGLLAAGRSQEGRRRPLSRGQNHLTSGPSRCPRAPAEGSQGVAGPVQETHCTWARGWERLTSPCGASWAPSVAWLVSTHRNVSSVMGSD